MNLYIHIPYCYSKCAYCSFLSFVPTERSRYINRLIQEIDERGKRFSNEEIGSVYFGGGTPSILEINELKIIFSKLEEVFVLGKMQEITIEANPEDLTAEKLEEWKSLGINRISIGVQTLNDKVRQEIGRRLNSEEVLGKVNLAQKYFKNVGVDLISGLPADDSKSMVESLRQFAKMGVKHISYYDLELDNESDMAKNPEKYNLLSEQKREKCLLNGWRALKKLGYKQYEISNFAKKGYECKHNLSFWHGENYLGFGLGAATRVENRYLTNNIKSSDYFKKYIGAEEVYDTKQEADFAVILGLRLDQKITKVLSRYKKASGKTLENQLTQLKNGGFIKNDFLTEKGKLFYNFVVDIFLI